MMTVRIYQPSKTALQSGKRKTKQWLVEFETQEHKDIEPLMGWLSSSDTRGQLRLFFSSLEEAIKFAKLKRLSYTISNPARVMPIPKNYGTNFTCSRIRGF